MVFSYYFKYIYELLVLVNNKCLSIYPCIAVSIPLVPFLRARKPYDSSFSDSLNTNPVRSHSPLGGVSHAPNTVNRNAFKYKNNKDLKINTFFFF